MMNENISAMNEVADKGGAISNKAVENFVRWIIMKYLHQVHY